MNTQIKCPHCKKSFEPTEALKHELEEKLLKEEQIKHKEEIELLTKKRVELEKTNAQKLEEIRKQTIKETRIEAGEKAKLELDAAIKTTKKEADGNARKNLKLEEDLEEKTKILNELKKEKNELRQVHKEELKKTEEQIIKRVKTEAQESIVKKLKDKENQILEFKKRAEQAEEQELKIRGEKRELEESKRKFELEKQRQLDEERGKIRNDAKKEAEEGMSLNLAQEKKKNEDAQKQILILQQKLQQGSQQSQGEVMELELEDLLKREFPFDKITEIKKGQRGADVVHEVIDGQGRNCGTILWESKNAKWSPGWVGKLKENQRQAKAEIAVLATVNTPPEIETFAQQDGVWITSRKMALPLALALRFDLVRVAFEKMTNVNKSEKAEVLYQYITSTEFVHRIEAIVETFTDMQGTIETEKRWFTSKWAKQEKQIRKVIDNTIGMRSDLNSLVGDALPAVDYLELPDSVDNDEASNK